MKDGRVNGRQLSRALTYCPHLSVKAWSLCTSGFLDVSARVTEFIAIAGAILQRKRPAEHQVSTWILKIDTGGGGRRRGRREQRRDVNSGVLGQGRVYVIVVVISFLIWMTDDCRGAP